MLEEDLTQKLQKLDDRIAKLEDMANDIEQASRFYLEQRGYFGDDPLYEDIEDLMQTFVRALYMSWDASDD